MHTIRWEQFRQFSTFPTCDAKKTNTRRMVMVFDEKLINRTLEQQLKIPAARSSETCNSFKQNLEMMPKYLAEQQQFVGLFKALEIFSKCRQFPR